MSKITAEFRQAAMRHGVIALPKARDNSANPAVANAAMVEMANLGFMVDPKEMQGVSIETLQEMLSDARALIGADRAMKPVYPGFPEQVQDLDTVTLLVEQILHYWSAGTLMPNHPDVAREGLPIEDMLRNARELKVESASMAAKNLIISLATSKIALSEGDKELLGEAMKLHKVTLGEVSEISKKAYNGENLQSFIRAVAATSFHSPDDIMFAALPGCANLDQALRVTLALFAVPSAPQWEGNFKLAVGNLSNGNARAIRMDNMRRRERRALVTRIGALSEGQKADSLLARESLWRVVMRQVHPFSLKLSAEEKRAMDIIHGNIEHRTLNSLIEEALEKGDVKGATELLAENRPGDLLNRLVAMMRLISTEKEATYLAKAVKKSASVAQITSLISAYNGVVAANDEHARVSRVAGRNNTMLSREVAKVSEEHMRKVAKAILSAMKDKLAAMPAPEGTVGTMSEEGVPLVRRDLATSERTLDRGQELTPMGNGDILRIFGHWNNNQNSSGYMDIGAVIMDEKFNHLAVTTWDTWSGQRSWSTYSGDKLVYPGDSAAEYFDLDIAKLRKAHPKARWIAMTVQSYSGWPMKDVDFIAGLMYRSGTGQKGEVFDARTVETAFKPTTEALQAVPYAYNLKTGKMVWLDSSSGSTASNMSASSDDTVGSIVYDELERERLTMGDLAKLWAKAHGVSVDSNKPVDRKAVLALLG